MDRNVLIQEIAEPLDGAKTARIELDADDGNMTIDAFAAGEPVLLRGTLEYYENHGVPLETLAYEKDKALFTLKGFPSRKSKFHLPWAACNGATNWAIHLNPAIPAAVIVHSDGGNLTLDLDGMTLSEVSASTGGGNIELGLPGDTANLSVTAKTGAGNVTIDLGSGLAGGNSIQASSGAGNVMISLPAGIAARIHASSGLGGTQVASQYSMVGKDTYQSADYGTASNRIEIEAKSGAGVVVINSK